VTDTIVERRRGRSTPGGHTPEHRSAPHPRVAARRRAVERRHSRRKMGVLITLAVISILAAALWPLAHSRFLSARVLSVAGNVHTPTAVVLSAAGLSSHPPMIDVNPGAAARAIEGLPWVAVATVARHWPDGVTVRVTERRAVAVVAEGTRFAELDQSGRVLAVVPAAPSGLARLQSVGAAGAPGTTVARARECLAVAAALPVAFASMVTAISPSPGGGVDLALSNGVGVVLGPPSQLPAKFEDIASLLAGAKLPPGSVIDVTVPPSPAVAPPAPAAAAASTTPTGSTGSTGSTAGTAGSGSQGG